MPNSPTILALDRNGKNPELLDRFLTEHGHHVVAATTLEAFDAHLNSEVSFALALIDFPGFGQTIWDRCERLREADIPLLVVSPRHSAQLQQATVTHCAQALRVKLLAVTDLPGVVDNLARVAEARSG